MSASRLEQQYIKLLRLLGSEPVTVTLQELADQLFCTRRHMRNVLANMQACGWINWQSETGRGNRSHLQLLRSEQQLLSDRAEQLLESGHFSEAINLLGEEKQLIAPLLRTKLGFSMRADHQLLRIPYYRPMPNLCPGTQLRRSEIHLVRQIFNGLTRVNEQTGGVETDLAHHWRKLDPLTWRFYLRPAVLFHDGRELQISDVVASLSRTAQLPLFSHLQQVEAAGAQSLIIRLSCPDEGLPLLLSHAAALILPADHAAQPDFAAHPIGTGPYRVVENDDWHLQMKAFDGYFGFRALLDEVDILMWPELVTQPDPATSNILKMATDGLKPITKPLADGLEAGQQQVISNDSATWLSSSISDTDYVAGLAASFTGRPSDLSREMFLEQGGYFLVCDSRSPLWDKREHRRWLNETLNPYALIQQLIAPIRHFWVPAGSLLPDWLHCMSACERRNPFAGESPVKDGRPVLRLAYYEQHPEYPMLARAMAGVLAGEGITLELLELDYDHWCNGDAQVDLWLGSVNFAVPIIWNVGAWLLSLPLLRRNISGGDEPLLEQWQQEWRDERLGSEQLAWQVVGSGWLQPLFHHWLRLKGPTKARGIHLNNLGWFDFKSTWLEPE